MCISFLCCRSARRSVHRHVLEYTRSRPTTPGSFAEPPRHSTRAHTHAPTLGHGHSSRSRAAPLAAVTSLPPTSSCLLQGAPRLKPVRSRIGHASVHCPRILPSIHPPCVPPSIHPSIGLVELPARSTVPGTQNGLPCAPGYSAHGQSVGRPSTCVAQSGVRAQMYRAARSNESVAHDG